MPASNWWGKMDHVLDHMRGRRCHLVVPVLAAILLLLHPRDATGKNFNFLYSDHLKGGLCTKGVRGEVADVTILDCTRTCHSDRLCISFIYEDITSTCHLYSRALNVTDDCVNHADHYFSYYFKLVGEEEVSAEVISAESPEESESGQDKGDGSSERSSSDGSGED